MSTQQLGPFVERIAQDRPAALSNNDSTYRTWAITGNPPMEALIEVMLEQLGLQGDHFNETPRRFANYLRTYRQNIDVEALLKQGFENDGDQKDTKTKRTQVVQAPIPFMGVCAHHLVPFFGAAAVGYLPTDRVVGLSKLTRLVYAAGHLAPTTQEDITNVVADALFNPEGSIKPAGVAVLTDSLHGCMAVRGTETPDTRTIVTAIRGAYEDNVALEDKFTSIALHRIG